MVLYIVLGGQVLTAQGNTEIYDYEPVLSIMIKPSKTFRYVQDYKNFSYSLYIGAAGGFASSLLSLYSTKYPFPYSLGEIVYSSFIMGVLYFIIANLAIALLLAKIGTIFGGKATFKKMFQTMCLTTVPYIWLMPVILFWMSYSPHTFFNIYFMDMTLGEAMWSYLGGFLIAGASIWSFVLSVVGVSEAHHFSKWKAFFTLLISSVSAAICFVLFIVLI
jgi:hypothetical protein